MSLLKKCAQKDLFEIWLFKFGLLKKGLFKIQQFKSLLALHFFFKIRTENYLYIWKVLI